mmetsp:Transcript_11053/g.24362  ORF Transcript_11053/g.24362 Transcript_11053/m.24362 type:complete len:177 (+) Transcript_11053:216-746(+)|eukprot:CAMPEP_0172325162 /NCGR_PEP_ID=MMETSP1058-20130122/53277_1 /TAXON_ID=83371 /ORGANISM="Detonula confervacea, Strain CCMP 353" /LENGTH=176 /DNA_ID=CAMNT_0013041633 /DNA_START=97 /DNA_END=627 /DNA_ORIENTATION=-
MAIDRIPLLAGGNIRRGQHIFGCCDSKRGTIIVNVLDILLTAISMIILTVIYNDPDRGKQATNQETVDHINNYYLASMIVSGITFAINLIVIFGAYIYNRRLVILGIVWIITRTVLTIVYDAFLAEDTDLHVLYIVLPILWALIMFYPQVIFILEVNSGIMSALTYSREKHCCCCV